MFVLREGESQTPTPKQGIISNWTGSTKIPFALYVCTEQHKQTIEKICETLSYWIWNMPICSS